MSATRVLIVDDQRIFRVLLHEILSEVPDIDLVGEASNGQEAIDMAEVLQPEVVLMDIELGGDLNGIQAGHVIKSRRPAIGIVLFSTHKSSEYIVKASGWSYLLKNNMEDVDTLIRAINGAAWGMMVVDPEVMEAMRSMPDSPMERLGPELVKVLELTAQGYDNAAIASKLRMSEQSVEIQQEAIFRELGIELKEDTDPRLDAIVAYISLNEQLPDGGTEVIKAARATPHIPLANLIPEQIKVLEMVAEGYSNKAIADALEIDERGVQEYLDVIYYDSGIGSDPQIDPRVTVALTFLEQTRAAASRR